METAQQQPQPIIKKQTPTPISTTNLTQERTRTKKARMLDALGKTAGIVSHAAPLAGITREHHYNWLHSDKVYADKVKALEQSVLDMAEATVISEMAGKDRLKAAIFYLENKGNGRGYGKASTNLQVNTQVNSQVPIREWLAKAIKKEDGSA